MRRKYAVSRVTRRKNCRRRPS